MTEIRAAFDRNVFGLMENDERSTSSYAQAKIRSHIINISSIGGLIASPGSIIYNSTKFAAEGLSESLALDVLILGRNLNTARLSQDQLILINSNTLHFYGACLKNRFIKFLINLFSLFITLGH